MPMMKPAEFSCKDRSIYEGTQLAENIRACEVLHAPKFDARHSSQRRTPSRSFLNAMARVGPLTIQSHSHCEDSSLFLSTHPESLRLLQKHRRAGGLDGSQSSAPRHTDLSYPIGFCKHAVHTTVKLSFFLQLSRFVPKDLHMRIEPSRRKQLLYVRALGRKHVSWKECSPDRPKLQPTDVTRIMGRVPAVFMHRSCS